MAPSVQIRTPFFVLTIIMAVVIGFLAGYLYTNQVNWNAQHSGALSGNAATAGTSNLPPAPPDTGVGQLPEGHPPINPDPTIAAMKKELQSDPNNYQKTVELANFLYDNKRFNDAIEWYQRALKLHPNNPDVETDLGTAYYYIGDSDSALKQYDQALRQDPQHVQTIHNKFIVLLEGKKDISAARATLKQLESVAPQDSSLPNLQEMLLQAEKGSS